MIDSREVIEIIQKDWKVFTWDKVSSWAWSYKLWIHVAIVVDSANERYVIWEWALYIMSWGALTKIAGQYNSDVMQTNKFKFRELENSNIGFLKQMVYLGSDDIDPIKPVDDFVEFWWTSVLSLWNKKSWFPVWINKLFNTSSDWSRYTAIYWMTTKATNYSGYNDTLYITYKNANWIYWVDTVDLDKQNYTTAQEWIVILPKFDWWNKSVEKRLNKISIRADFWNDAWKFYIYKVVWNTLVPFNWSRDQSYIKHTAWFWVKELVTKDNFFNITIAVVFKQDADTLKNECLKLYSLTYNYDPVK